MHCEAQSHDTASRRAPSGTDVAFCCLAARSIGCRNSTPFTVLIGARGVPAIRPSFPPLLAVLAEAEGGGSRREEMTMISKGFAVVIAGFGRDLARSCRGRDAGNDEGRYTFSKVADGFLRLDTQTGEVSLCSRQHRRLGMPGGARGSRRARERDRAPAQRKRRAQEGHPRRAACRCRPARCRSRWRAATATAPATAAAMPISIA